jgi:hypothetical protein
MILHTKNEGAHFQVLHQSRAPSTPLRQTATPNSSLSSTPTQHHPSGNSSLGDGSTLLRLTRGAEFLFFVVETENIARGYLERITIINARDPGCACLVIVVFFSRNFH